MTQRDIIKDQIEQLGRVLGKITAELLDLDNRGDLNDGIELATQQLQNEADIDLNKLVLMSEEELKSFFANKNFESVTMDRLADLLVQLGKRNLQLHPTEVEKYFQTALRIYNLADEHSGTFCFAKAEKVRKVEGLIQQRRDDS